MLPYGPSRILQNVPETPQKNYFHLLLITILLEIISYEKRSCCRWLKIDEKEAWASVCSVKELGRAWAKAGGGGKVSEDSRGCGDGTAV